MHTILLPILRLLIAIASSAVIDTVVGVTAASRISGYVAIAKNSHQDQRQQCGQRCNCRMSRPLRRAHVQNLETRQGLHGTKGSSSQGTRREPPELLMFVSFCRIFSASHHGRS